MTDKMTQVFEYRVGARRDMKHFMEMTLCKNKYSTEGL